VVIGLSRGSVVVDTVFLPPVETSQDQRSARQLMASLKVRVCVCVYVYL